MGTSTAADERKKSWPAVDSRSLELYSHGFEI